MKGLEGIKVVELTGYVAAPACPRILGEMGATIYKIEPFSGDEYRTNGPGFGMQKTDIDDPAFDLASMNKEFLSVNLKDPEGAAFVEKLRGCRCHDHEFSRQCPKEARSRLRSGACAPSSPRLGADARLWGIRS